MNPSPRWRGFNLLYFFSTRSDGRPVEEDFRWDRLHGHALDRAMLDLPRNA